MKNIVLIGMPGCGKSTCGVLLAKALGKNFTDTDLIIQRNEKMTLQDIITNKGGDYFALAEERAVCETKFSDCVIATGGSVVYSEKAMRALAENAKIIYLKISYGTMLRRINNIKTRGILLREGESIESMYKNRQSLYERYADKITNCDGKDIEETVKEVIDSLNNYPSEQEKKAETIKQDAIIYTDGACSGNPGPGGWACILVCGETEKELSGSEESTTNNRMEITAAIKGLEALKKSCNVTVVSDSAYLCDSVMKGWIFNWQKKDWARNKDTPVPNCDLWQRLCELIKLHNVIFSRVPGHSGHPYNERCDKLAVSEYQKYL